MPFAGVHREDLLCTISALRYAVTHLASLFTKRRWLSLERLLVRMRTRLVIAQRCAIGRRASPIIAVAHFSRGVALVCAFHAALWRACTWRSGVRWHACTSGVLAPHALLAHCLTWGCVSHAEARRDGIVQRPMRFQAGLQWRDIGQTAASPSRARSVAIAAPPWLQRMGLQWATPAALMCLRPF